MLHPSLHDPATAIMYGNAIARVHSGRLNECRPDPGGCQLVYQAENLTLTFHHKGTFGCLFQPTFSCLRQDLCPSEIGRLLLPPQGYGTLPSDITSALSFSVFCHLYFRSLLLTLFCSPFCC